LAQPRPGDQRRSARSEALNDPLERTTIGCLNESPLHAALKNWLAQPGDRCEEQIEGFRIDIVRGDLLIEVQTRNFSALKHKLWRLVPQHRLRLVYPVAREKRLLKRAGDGQGRPSRRKSPKRGRVEDLFRELVSFPELALLPNFSLEVLLIQEEEVRHHDARRAWRRQGWVTEERRLLQVLERRVFETPADYGALLPGELADPFTTADLAQALRRPRSLAQKMAYCLRRMDVIGSVGRRDRYVLYSRGGGAPVRDPRT